jgi:hypothetical protein
MAFVSRILFLALAFPAIASACSVCYGEPESPASRGLSWAITALALIVMCVLAGAVMFFVQANRKANLLQASDDARSSIEKS